MPLDSPFDETISGIESPFGAASGGGWLPTDLPNLVGTYDADNVTEVSSLITQWDDLSGLGNHFPQVGVGEQPEIVDVGGKNYVGFQVDGNQWFTAPALTGQHSVYALVQQSAKTNLIIFGDGSSATTTLALGTSGSTSTDVYRQVGSPTAYLGESVNSIADRGDVFTLLDGGPKVIGFDNYTADNITRLGGTPATFFAPNMRGMIIVSGTPTSGERSNIVAYLGGLA